MSAPRPVEPDSTTPLEGPPRAFEPARNVRVKICGVTEPSAALHAAEAGADWIGLNFHPASKRFLEPDQAAPIVQALRTQGQAEPVGVFVNRPAESVRETARSLRLRIVQLHGDEPPEHLPPLKQAGLTVVRAFRIADRSSIAAMSDWLQAAEALQAAPDAALIDAFVPGVPGGSGQAIDPALVDDLDHVRREKRENGRPLRLILAGGLTPENVAERARRFRPWMVDVASGVEAAPRRTDPAKVAAFIQAARSLSKADSQA